MSTATRPRRVRSKAACHPLRVCLIALLFLAPMAAGAGEAHEPALFPAVHHAPWRGVEPHTDKHALPDDRVSGAVTVTSRRKLQKSAIPGKAPTGVHAGLAVAPSASPGKTTGKHLLGRPRSHGRGPYYAQGPPPARA